MTGPTNGGRFPAPATWEPNQEIPVGGTVGIRPKSLRRLFEQGKFWRTRDGEWVRVKDMHPAHRANAARKLLREAADYALKVSMAELRWMSVAPDEVVDAAFREDAERSADPEAWMRGTKLYRRLVKGLPVRHAEGVPVHLAGKCQVCDERREMGEVPAAGLPEEDTVTVAPSVWTKVADGVVVVHQQPDPVELQVMVAPKPRDPVTAAAARIALEAVLAVFAERTARDGDLWDRALRHSDVPATVAEAAKQIGVTL